MSKRAIRPFIRTAYNKDAYEAVAGDAQKLLLTGPSKCGKTTLLRAYTASIDSGDRENAMLSSASEICVSLFVKENEALLEKMGTVPVLLVDDIHNCAAYEQGAQALQLLTNARAGAGLRTVLSSSHSIAELESLLADLDLSDCAEVELSPLALESFPTFISAYLAFYGGESAPVLADEAALKIAEMSEGCLDKAESMVRYLATGMDLGSDDRVTPEFVTKCFE